MNKLKNNKFCYNNYPLLTGLFIRTVLFMFASINNFIYPDEISFLYNCKTLVENGTDALGQSYPIYFNTWLVGGHSPFPLYITSLSIKIFGVNFFALKLPSFLLGCLSFYVFSKLIPLLTENAKKQKTIVLLDAFCMGSINMAVFILDCWWMNYFLTFGLYSFFYGIKHHKKTFLYISTLFFCLGFYCYIASIFIIPILLVGLYIVQLKNKTISIKTTILNALEAIIIAIPFVIFGLVALGKIKPFEFLNITFPNMSLYTRNSYIGFSLQGIKYGIIALISNFSILFTFYGISFDIGILSVMFAAFILLNKVNPKNIHALPICILIPLIIPVIIFICFTSTTWPYRIASFLILVTIPIYFTLADILDNKLIKDTFVGIMVCTLVVGMVSSTSFLSKDHYYLLSNYIKENDIQLEILTSAEDDDNNEEYSAYEQAWWSYKFRLEFPDDNYINFKDEQTERYYGKNTVQVSNRLLTTMYPNDIHNDKYLLTSSKEQFKNRKLIGTYDNYGARKNTWYLYSPVS